MLHGCHAGIWLPLLYLQIVSIHCWVAVQSPWVARRLSRSNFYNIYPFSTPMNVLLLESRSNDVEIGDSYYDDSCSRDGGRRLFLSALAPILCFPMVASARADDQSDALERIRLGIGRWKPLTDMEPDDGMLFQPSYSATFCAYAARFMIRYDINVRSWWTEWESSVNKLDPVKAQDVLDRAFGSFAKTLDTSFRGTTPTQLYDLFVYSYGDLSDDETLRQIALLFTLLPESQQPISRLESYCNSRAASKRPTSSQWLVDSEVRSDVKQLLPGMFDVKKLPKENGKYSFVVEPFLPFDEIAIDNDAGPAAIVTLFGPVLSHPLMRELPKYSFQTYLLLGVSGAMGCALTHSVVIPLDVLKTRAQTDPDVVVVDDNAQGESRNRGIVRSSMAIVETEGLGALLLGAQATIVGYFWYGLSIYPSYALLKRYLSNQLFSFDYAISHGNEIALLAGAASAVVASFGLAPIEAARIRVVADPGMYRPLGLSGTLGVIATEDAQLGWKNLYSSLPSLLTRQVIFGSVKFLAFERACQYIFHAWPELRDATWTCFAVSLVAGGWSGVVSAVFSQPADSVLTYIAKENRSSSGGTNIVAGVQRMVAEGGMPTLFRGLGSRCVWSGCIIAGQFLLYDIFRTLLGVSSENLSQVFEVVLPTS